MQSSIFLCLSQARINWEGCGRNGNNVKMGGGDGGGSLISSEGVAASWTVGVSTSVIFPCTIKVQKIMVGKSTIIGYHPVGAPHAYANRCGNPARMQHNPVLRRRVVFMMT